jgi:hypothetical protein
MIIHALRLLAGTFALATSVFVAEASGAELKVLSAGAMRAALQELVVKVSRLIPGAEDDARPFAAIGLAV